MYYPEKTFTSAPKLTTLSATNCHTKWIYFLEWICTNTERCKKTMLSTDNTLTDFQLLDLGTRKNIFTCLFSNKFITPWTSVFSDSTFPGKLLPSLRPMMGKVLSKRSLIKNTCPWRDKLLYYYIKTPKITQN